MKKLIDERVGTDQRVFILDGDIIRSGLNKDLGFTAEDRSENIRRISEVSKLFALSGQICIVAFISPYEKDRQFARECHKKVGLDFIECHIAASLEVCEERDVKGLYVKARAGIIKNFTGISDPYEAPANPEMIIDTGKDSLDACREQVFKYLMKNELMEQIQTDFISEGLISPVSIENVQEFEKLKSLDLDLDQAMILNAMSQGWLYPLNRFMNQEELCNVLNTNSMTIDGKRHLMSLPLIQPLHESQFQNLKKQEKIALKCSSFSEQVLAVMNEPSYFDFRKEDVAARTFGTTNRNHPTVKRMLEQGDMCVTSQSMQFFQSIQFNDGMDKYRLTPKQIAQ